MRYCQYCGQKIDDDAKFCEHCGAKVEIEQPVQPEVVSSAPTASGAPHWLLKMLSILGLICSITIFEAYIGLGCGIAGLILDKKKEFRGRYIASIIIGGIACTLIVTYYIVRIFVASRLY